LLNVEKNSLLIKQTQVSAEKSMGRQITQKLNEKTEMLPITFDGNLYKTHAVLSSKIAVVHTTSVHEVRT